MIFLTSAHLSANNAPKKRLPNSHINIKEECIPAYTAHTT